MRIIKLVINKLVINRLNNNNKNDSFEILSYRSQKAIIFLILEGKLRLILKFIIIIQFKKKI